ncbi:MAG: hypothetical protein Q4G09_00260 [Clostridia bacterium]|nr:hypothetical protein [Clostridia bacterium]
MNKYRNLKQRHIEEVDKFPLMFAFSDEQFNEGMKKLGLNPEDTKEITSIGFGGFVKKSDLKDYIQLCQKHKEEIQNEINHDKDGTGFIKDMFIEELINHEYGYTHEIDAVLDALSITPEEVNRNKNLKNGLKIALERCFSKNYDEKVEDILLNENEAEENEP